MWSNITQKKISITDANHMLHIDTFKQPFRYERNQTAYMGRTSFAVKTSEIDIGEQAHVATLNSKTHTQSSNT